MVAPRASLFLWRPESLISRHIQQPTNLLALGWLHANNRSRDMALILERSPRCNMLEESTAQEGFTRPHSGKIFEFPRLHDPWRNGNTLPMATTRETYRNFSCGDNNLVRSPSCSFSSGPHLDPRSQKLANAAIDGVPRLTGRPGFFPDGPHSGLRSSHIGFDRNRVARSVELKRPSDRWRDGTTLAQATTREAYKKEVTTPLRAPAWDVLEGYVLQFGGHFREHLDETSEGNQRMRSCKILYYLEDDTMQVVEPSVDNSGMPQGVLIKRHQIPHSSSPGSIISPSDLRVGENISVYGKTFAITSCDAFTRRWYQESGICQRPNQDSVGAHRKSERLIKRRNTDDNSSGARGEGKAIRDMSEISMNQFPTNQTKVCRFFAILDDCSKGVFERRKISILYHLSDDTIELREIHPERCGRERFSIFLRRSKVLKSNAGEIGPSDELPPDTAFFRLSDFKVGCAVFLANRELFIYAADPFTVDYFRDELGIELESPVNITLDCLPPLQSASGAGALSIKSAPCGIVEPALTCHREARLKAQDKKQPFVFASILQEQRPPGVAPRVMHIVFDPEDQSIAIHERSVRNSGLNGGRFLQSAVYINESTGQPFRLEEFAEGKTICINKHNFTITGALYPNANVDERTSVDGGSNRVVTLLQKLCDGLGQRLVKAKDMFATFDEYRNNLLTYQDFQRGMERLGFDITKQEALEIARHFDTNENGKVDYVEFCTALAKLETSSRRQKTPLHRKMLLDENAYGEIALLENEKLEAAKGIHRSVRQLQAIFRQQPRLLQLLTKEFSRVAQGRIVSLEDATKIFSRFGCSLSTPEAQAAIKFLLPGSEEHRIDYIDLISALKTTYFDLTSPKCL